MVNMKFRKLKKNNVRNTNKTRQLNQEVLELSSMGIHACVQRRDREQTSFVEIKSVLVVNMWKFDNSFSPR